MTAVAQEFPKAFAVLFKDLERWDVSSFQQITWHWAKEVMTPLGSVLQMRKEKVDRSKVTFSDLQPITIHFDGSIDPRNVDENRAYTMELFYAHVGDIVVSKIDLKNGAVGIVPEELSKVVVTNHFAVYRPDLERLSPDYFQLIIQAKFFKAHLWRNKVGAEGRKEVKLDFFEALEIPLPPIAIQQAIVNRWQTAQAELKAISKRLENQGKEILLDIQTTLGRERASELNKPKAFALWWSEIEKWGVDMCWRERIQRKQSNYPIAKISDVCKIGSGGTPSRRKPSYFGGDIPWVKTTEVRNAVIYETEESITQTGLNNSSAKVYPAGSVIIAMYGQGATRGRTAKLGIEAATNQACAVLTKFADGVDPDFIWVYLMSEYDGLRELASGNNQPNLNADIIANYPVPIPPWDVQKAMVQRVEIGRQAIAREREAAERKKQDIEADIEALILGIKAIEV